MKNKFIKSTLILLISGLITKIFSFIIKIIYTRLINIDSLNLYQLIIPTYSLIISISSFSMPISISKLVSEKKYTTKNIIYNSFIILTIINIIIILLFLTLSKYISYNLLHEQNAYLVLLISLLTIPFISISSIIKGYFFGNMNMIPNSISNIIEQIIRTILVIILVPYFSSISLIYGASSLFIISIITEIISIIVNILFLPKKLNIKNIKYNKNITTDLLNISIPNTSSRLIGNIGYFFEPILLMNILLYTGYDKSYILYEYGIFNAYSLNILTMPSFFVMALCYSLVPEITRLYKEKNYIKIKSRIKYSCIYTIIIGIFFSIILMLFGKNILHIIYNNNLGYNYILFLAPVFPLFYIENILISSMQAMDLSKTSMTITLYGVIIKLISLSLLSFLKIGIYSLLISLIINILFVVITNYIVLNNKIKKLQIP